MKQAVRLYGEAPYRIAVVHGGPGAPGSVAPVAKQLEKKWGVLEPLQTQHSVMGQVEELKSQLRDFGSLPVILIGHSWGAFLGFILTAKNPSFVKKLILIGSGPFKSKYTKQIMKIRLERLDKKDKEKFERLVWKLNQHGSNLDSVLQKFGQLMSKADSYESSIDYSENTLEVQADINEEVWREAKRLRANGTLLSMGSSISCPVVAIHGTYDPHPVEGVEKPLSKILNNFKMIKLEKCGHYPWQEKFARNDFFKSLEKEISISISQT